MVWAKKVHRSAKSQTFDWSHEVLPSLYFDRLLLLKVYTISAKKVQRSYDSRHWRVMQNLKKNDSLFQKWQEFGEFWSDHSKVSNICTLIGSFRAKYITFDLKKYRGVIFYDTDEPCKICRKSEENWGNGHEKFGKFWPEHLKVSKLGLLFKVENVCAWNLQGNYVSWNWRVVQNLKRNWLVISKLTRIIWRM